MGGQQKMGYGSGSNNRRRSPPGIKSHVVTEADKQTMDKAAESGNDAFTLEIDGTPVKFKLYTVKHEELETKTFVSPENIRNQSIVNALSLKGMIHELKAKGQISPGISILNSETGQFEVIEGSQRRAGCIHLGMDFVTWGTDVNVVAESKKGISQSGNYFKSKSLFEYGFEWDKLAKEDGLSISEIATLAGKHRSIVRAALNVHAIPQPVLDVIPSIPDLGRPLIESLVKKTTNLTEEHLNELAVFCNTLSNEKNDLIQNADSGTAANQQIIKKICGFDFSAPVTSDDQNNEPAPVSVKTKLADGSQIKWKHDSTQKTVSLQLDQFGEEQLTELKALLNKWGVEV